MTLKKKKSNKTFDGKNCKPKKKAQIITSIRQHKTPQVTSKKSINNSHFGEELYTESPVKWENDNSIKSFKR